METDAHGNAFVARSLWHYLRGVHPADRQYAERKEVEEEESEGYKEPQGLMDGDELAYERRERQGRCKYHDSPNTEHDCYHDHTKGTCSSTGYKYIATAHFLDEEVGAGEVSQDWDCGMIP